jgi:UDP-N-acetylglucosamine:LPS N-acetylglucosamine transferase
VAAAPEVLLLIVDAGGGHRAAARALAAAGEARRVPWTFRILGAQDLFAPLDVARRLTGSSLEDTYNAMVRRGRTRHLVPLLRAYQWAIRRLHRRLQALVEAELRARPPCLVVSLFPNLNAVFRDAVRAALPGVPFMVVLTDLADFPPHFWMEPGLDCVVTATEHGVRQALAAGIPRGRVQRTSGMILHPRFYPCADAAARSRVRAELGIGAGDFAVLVLFGGKGAPEVRPLAEALLARGPRWHVVAICGDNLALFDSLAAAEARAGGRLHRLPFTDRVCDYMVAADVVATKPGPGSIAEALHQRVPVVVPCDARTIPQERYNARWIEETGVGAVVPSWRGIPEAVARFAEDRAWSHAVRERVRALPENRAVWEVLDALGAELEVSDAGVRALA